LINHFRRVSIMRKSIISVSLAALLFVIWPATALAATDPTAGQPTLGTFAVLSGAGMTNTGPSWISGAIGAPSFTGFPPGVAGPQIGAGTAYTTAETELTAAYGAAVQGCTADYSGINLGGLAAPLGPGVYCQTTGAVPSPVLTGTLTLNGPGIYIFLIGTTAAPTTLTTAAGGAARVILTGGAQPCDVFWRVTSTATIDTGTAFIGTIMADQSVIMRTGATLWGRALSRIAAVTLDTNRIIQPSGCTTGLTTNYPAPAPVLFPGSTLPASLGTIVTAPPTPTPSAGTGGTVLPGNTGVPPDLRGGGLPMLLVIGVGAGLAATAIGMTARRRRRRTQ
jgi:Ice-binding-like